MDLLPIREEFADVIDVLKGEPPKDRRLDAIQLEIDGVYHSIRDYLEAEDERQLAEARSTAAFELLKSKDTNHEERQAADKEHKRAAERKRELEARADQLREQFRSEIDRLSVLWRIEQLLEES